MSTTNIYAGAIANAGMDSNTIALESTETLLGIGLGDFTSATLTFVVTLARNDANTYTVYNNGAVFSIDVVADSYVVLDPTVFLGVRSIQIISSVAQEAARTFYVVTREL